MPDIGNLKPASLSEYGPWLVEVLKCAEADVTRERYDLITAKLLADIQKGPVWTGLLDNFQSWADRYLRDTGYHLFTSPEVPLLRIKPFDSFLLKGLRRNILDNQSWPDPPVGGWLFPDNWWTSTPDVIRTILVVKYLDGVQYLASQIGELCEAHTGSCNVDFKASEFGYYAAHVNFNQKVNITKLDWGSDTIALSVEIQITTQLQEVIGNLTHQYYEKRRIITEPRNIAWQWDHESDEFVPNYLGHILHYVEGMIMEVRNREANI